MNNPVTLTKREQKVAILVGKGLHNKNIAKKMGIAEKTVDHFLSCVYDKYRATGIMDGKHHQRVMLALIINGVIKNGSSKI